MTVSVIVTTKNEASRIAECLRSIKSQSYPPAEIEIIVVDNRSTDGTREAASRFTDRIFDFGPERSAQRNLGVKKSAGKYVLYLDADMILSREVIAECVEKCEREGKIALCIPERIVGRGFWIRARNFERSFYDGTPIDCVRFFRRDGFVAVGGFDENLTGPEDWDFDRRIRGTGETGIIESCIEHNEGSFDLRKYLAKKNYYSRDFAKYVEKWGGTDPTVRRQLGFRYRYFVVFTENGKIFRLLRHPLLAAGMYCLRFMVGLGYVTRKRKGA